ncbi:hypothetical protein MKK75_31000 [Methylobacterium sp. J-030]|uniref:hypothetical protein n=1 Tax=Methylobacterium sp. J-030 TaxID=2836627 RepID=UPI001FB8FDE0|nr:hypothetical protein [Methylobacterium sp. J-030]MCJ2073162.1 hypothetical protein [Methylobacterium sp. J-030]
MIGNDMPLEAWLKSAHTFDGENAIRLVILLPASRARDVKGEQLITIMVGSRKPCSISGRRGCLSSASPAWRTPRSLNVLSSAHRFVPDGGWGDAVAGYADSFVTLNELRMLADYDPTYVVLPLEAARYILLARSAINLLDTADPVARRAFLALLLVPPR